MSKENVGSNLVFFLVGAALGASVALLYAPQDGESTRRLITDKAADAKDRAAELTAGVTGSAKEKWNATADKIQGIIQKTHMDETKAAVE